LGQIKGGIYWTGLMLFSVFYSRT